jgi:hypothetical protein
MPPQVDFRRLSDALTPEEALEMPRRTEPGRQERIARLLERGCLARSTPTPTAPSGPLVADAQTLVDAHHHVWNLDLRPQPWPNEPGHEPIRRDFSSHALRSAATRPIAGRRLTSTVVVQCVATLPETPGDVSTASWTSCPPHGNWARAW